MSHPEEARPRRLVSRYALALAVRVQPEGLPFVSCQARNVGTAGMFLATDKAPELLSRVTISVAVPGGRAASLAGRVVHVLSAQRARSLGAVPGVGVQFESLGRQEQAFVEELVAWARAHDPRPRIARRKPAADPHALQHEPMLGFLLGYVDGKRDPEALAEELALEVETIERMLAELVRHGAIELVSSASEQRAPQRAAASEPPPVVSKQPLSTAQRDELRGLESRLQTADPYVLLGVPPSTSAEQARSAFLKHNAELRPSIRPAEEAERIARVLGQMRQAASVLSSGEQKEEYDAYKERAEWLVAAEALRGRMSIPPPAPGPSDTTDEEIDFRLPPPPSDATPTAQHKRPAREPSRGAHAAAAALRRPSGVPRRVLPPTAAAAPTQPPPGAPSRAPQAGAPLQPASAAQRAEVARAAAAPTRPPGGEALRSASAAPRAQQLTAAARAGANTSARSSLETQPPRASASATSPTQRPAAGAARLTDAARAGASANSPTQPPAAGDVRATSAAHAAKRPTQPPVGPVRSARPSRGPGGTRSGRPSRPAAAAQAEAAAQAAAEQAAAAAALSARGRPSQSPSPSKPVVNEPPLGAAGQLLAQAEAAHSAGNLAEASRHLKLLSAMTFEDPRLQARFAELKLKVMRTAAVDIEKQAAYEEKQQHWSQAARSWLRVVDGRPNDSVPLQRAALALLRAGTDLRTAMDSAKRAVELAPNDAEAHRTLAKVYVAADMQASARRELEAAQRCSGIEASEEGPTGLLKRLLGRDDAG